MRRLSRKRSSTSYTILASPTSHPVAVTYTATHHSTNTGFSASGLALVKNTFSTPSTHCPARYKVRPFSTLYLRYENCRLLVSSTMKKLARV